MPLSAASPDALSRALSLAVMQPTVAGGGIQPFARLHELLSTLFPRLFSSAVCATVGGGALLLRLPGQQSVRPSVFLSHLDVVPPGDESRWTYPPFSGAVRNGYVYGRGAADMKGHLIALLFAAESLLSQGWQPRGDIWFALSCDEELRGGSMAAMTRLMRSQGVSPGFVLDEGGSVAEPYSILRSPAAFVGVAEKGRLMFSVTGDGPAVMERLSRASAQLSRLTYRPRICPPVESMLRALAPHLSAADRLMSAHPRQFKPILIKRLSATPTGRAVTRTQMMIWKMEGDAILSHTPCVSYSASVLPGDSVDRMLKKIYRITDRFSLRVTLNTADDPGPSAPGSGDAWDALVTAIQVHFPGVPIIPCLLAGGTDGRRMESLCPCVYRFSPFLLPPEEMARVHSADERMSIQNLILGEAFFRQMLQA